MASPASPRRLPLRLADTADVPALARLYAQCARAMGPQCYTPEQVAAWASFGADTPAFRDYILTARTWIALDDDGRSPIGFCGIGPQGEVHSLYVRPDRARQGLGTRLLTHAMADARAQGVADFGAWATPLSRPLFERAGLAHVRSIESDFQGVSFTRHRVGRD